MTKMGKGKEKTTKLYRTLADITKQPILTIKNETNRHDDYLNDILKRMLDFNMIKRATLYEAYRISNSMWDLWLYALFI